MPKSCVRKQRKPPAIRAQKATWSFIRSITRKRANERSCQRCCVISPNGTCVWQYDSGGTIGSTFGNYFGAPGIGPG
ncbi:MAG: hypothetical protein QOJ51_6670 [Acidobacteriaceae bacterium]|jgi:hypothetical protein|nr:hypothetical protein [Acidobacteriaceae bacterium]